MSKTSARELTLELGPEKVRLQMDGLALNLLLGHRTLAAETPFPAPHRLQEELDYYRQFCQEIYQGLGSLAKEMNLSIQDLSLEEIIRSDQASPGERLDQARTQVTDVLAMTERATLNILEMVESIREDCARVRSHLEMLQTASDNDRPMPPNIPTGSENHPWQLLLSQADALEQRLREGLPATEAPTGPRYFPLNEVLQVLKEFCTSESVKSHLEALLAHQETIFPVASTEAAICRMAATVAVEDGLHQFPVEELLSLLREHCLDERGKELFSKVSASAGMIFPLPVLPLEGHLNPGCSGSTAPPPILAAWEDLYHNLRRVVGAGPHLPQAPAGAPSASAETAAEAIGAVDRITTSLARIMEALTFQDLSGQRLLKLLKLFRQLQVQILTLVIAAAIKLKTKDEQQEISLRESNLLAQDQVDRLLASVTGGHTSAGDATPLPPREDAPLDQAAINDLLTTMGF